MKTKASIVVKNKSFPYSIEKNKDGSIHIVVKSAKINQSFLPEDVPNLILDLPNLILSEQDYKEKQNEVIRFRISGKEKIKIEKKALEKGYHSISKYLRDIALS